MRNYCEEIQSEKGSKYFLLPTYQSKLRKVAEWYKSQHSKYSKILQTEIQQEFLGESLHGDSELKLAIDDYEDNFATKLSLFCVADFLCKHIISTYSFGPVNTVTRQFNSKKLGQSWFEYKGNANEVTEILQAILAENNEGNRINLSVLLEDRPVRSKLTHSGDIATCLSAIRCYNIIRDMIIFMDSDYESQLSRFTYPDDIHCDMQAFFSHTNNLNFNHRTTILVAGSLNDIPGDQRAILANMPWDIVIDFDGYTEYGGLQSVVNHSQIHPQLLTKETAESAILKKGITQWFKCGQLVTPSHDEQHSNILKVLPTKIPFYTGKFNKYHSKVSAIFKEILQKVAQKLNPVTIVYLHPDDQIAQDLLKVCEEELDSVSYAFSGIYYWSNDTIQNLERNIFSSYLRYNYDYSNRFQFIQSDLDSFFRGLKEYEVTFTKREDVSTDTLLPSNDGYKELSINQAQNVETYFEVLYKGCGQEEQKKAKELISDFYRGGNAPWCAFASKETADLIPQNEFYRMIHKIKTQLGRIPDANKDKVFYLEHTPGIGGSTLLRRIGWELHSDYPVLLIHRFDKNRISKIITDLYDYLSKGVVVLADEYFENIAELETIIKETPRACVLIAAVRQNGERYNAQKLPFSAITSDSERQIRRFIKEYSPLSKDDLELKDAGYDNFIRQDISSMRCPFMIALYYMDKHFNGIDGYAERVIANITHGEKEIKAIAFMALCDIYGQESLPAVFVNKYLGLNPRSNYINTNESIKSAFYIPNNQEMIVYRPKHYLISQNLLDKCSQYLYGEPYREKLADLATELIEAIFEECKEKFADAYHVILEKVFIKNRIGYDMNQSDFSKIIEEVPLSPKKKEILLKLATLSAKLADEVDPKEYQQIYMMTAHFYGHLSRLCSKYSAGIGNVGLATEYSEKSMEYMEMCGGQDSRVYHMHGQTKRAVLKDKWDKLVRIKEELPDSEFSNFEDEIDKIISIFSLAGQTGSPDYALTSQMNLLMDYLYFVYRKKGINSVDQLAALSPKQQQYRTDIEGLISALDGVELDDNTRSIYSNLLNEYRSNIMMNQFGQAIEYYTNRIEYLLKNNGSASEIISAKHGLVNARFGKYRFQSADGSSYYKDIPAKEVEEILHLLDDIIEHSFDINKYQARQRRISIYNRWLQLAKYSSQSVDKGIIVALKWKELEEKDKLNDPRPYYYLYVLYYLSVLEGNRANSSLATEYQKLSYQKALSAGRKLNYIWDFFVEGMGMGQLQNANSVIDWSNIIESGDVDFRPITGHFDRVVSKKGIVKIQDPINWHEREAKFRIEENNTLGENQVTHKVKFYGGFGFEQIIALDLSVKDDYAGEELPIIIKKKNVRNSVANSYFKDFIPSFVQQDPNTGTYYLNGKVDNKNAGLSSMDIFQFGPQVDAYIDAKAILNLLNKMDKFQVKCYKFNGRRTPVSLFETGKTLFEILGEPKLSAENRVSQVILGENNNSPVDQSKVVFKDTYEEPEAEEKETLPEFIGEVSLKVLEFTRKGVKGTFVKEGKIWIGSIPTGISKKEGKQICGKTIRAKIISKNNKEYILKK
ncbi:hypothetical protein ACE38V_17265 [Cytobacillus sp. Hz8]|uniref:hypothetical protein n=1 Tax=Cytobacillus sp. Hz8 TaxID=3347168 RepID=UPI0035DDBB76